MKFGPKFTDLHSSPKERQLQKSWVSFGEECTSKVLAHSLTLSSSFESSPFNSYLKIQTENPAKKRQN